MDALGDVLVAQVSYREWSGVLYNDSAWMGGTAPCELHHQYNLLPGRHYVDGVLMAGIVSV